MNTTDEKYIRRQQKREVHHLKRNKRKNNPNTRPLVRDFSAKEKAQRKVLLELTARPLDMPQALFKALTKERKQLVNEHPKAEKREVPNMSNKHNVPRVRAVKFRRQLAPVLANKRTTTDLAHGPNNTTNYRENDLYFYSGTANSLRKTGWYKIIGVRTIKHIHHHNTQLHG